MHCSNVRGKTLDELIRLNLLRVTVSTLDSHALRPHIPHECSLLNRKNKVAIRIFLNFKGHVFIRTS